MTDMVRVRPWPGLILDGIPTGGADIPRALAEEWTANHLVIPVRDRPTPSPVPSAGRAKPTTGRKRRRTR